jgi:hypothetical protein
LDNFTASPEKQTNMQTDKNMNLRARVRRVCFTAKLAAALALPFFAAAAPADDTRNTAAPPVAGATETTPSRSQYFSWINNTNEGATEAQTLVNLGFFEWLQKEYGMRLDIYAFDAGFLDGPRNAYGSPDSKEFKTQFPNGIGPVYRKAKSIGTRLGHWGGPDGFGNTEESAAARKEMLVSLARDYEWALFKFDSVCGRLRADKVDHFVDMMKQVRSYSPDLILLNHRLNLYAGKDYATTFLWGGEETYIDVHMSNRGTAAHNRAGALARGLVPDLKRLTEDHGVCLSSCLDYWEDDLVLQAFNRSLILAPEIYGNPWLLRDEEFPKLARIYNLHRKFRDILVHGKTLPESYGVNAVSRGDGKTRLVTLRNLTWLPQKHVIRLDEEIGLAPDNAPFQARLFHPTEKILGSNYKFGDEITVEVQPFRALLFFVSNDKKHASEIGVEGADYEVVKDVPGQPVQIRLFGLPGSTINYKITGIGKKENKTAPEGKVTFPGKPLQHAPHRKLATLEKTDVPADAGALYEATVFAADNNALEARCIDRSGDTKIPQVKAARDAFFNQPLFIQRRIWDKFLFDGDANTAFAPQDASSQCAFRLDIGAVQKVDTLVIQPAAAPNLSFKNGNNWASIDSKIRNAAKKIKFKPEEAVVQVSEDLKTWRPARYKSGSKTEIEINGEMRYFRLTPNPGAIAEVEARANGEKLNPAAFRASNLFADSSKKEAVAAWANTVVLDEVAKNSYFCIAVNGRHGNEGAYAAIKVDGQLVGAPARAVSYPANGWEYFTRTSDSNYTYYIPIKPEWKGKKIEVFVLAYDKNNLSLTPEVWISSYPAPYETKFLEIER